MREPRGARRALSQLAMRRVHGSSSRSRYSGGSRARMPQPVKAAPKITMVAAYRPTLTGATGANADKRRLRGQCSRYPTRRDERNG
jgi:hypothetical protein